MIRVALKNLLARKMRLILISLLVVAGVAFVSGTFVLTDTLANVFDGLFTDVNRGVDVAIRGAKAFKDTAGGPGTQVAREPVPAALLRTVQAVSGVRAAEGAVQGYALVVRLKDGKPAHAIQPSGAPTLGVSWGTDRTLNGFVGGDGRPEVGRRPRAPNEVALDEVTARKAHVSSTAVQRCADHGECARAQVQVVFLETPPQIFNVVALIQFGTVGNLAGATLALFDTPTAQQVLNRAGRFESIRIAADSGVSATDLRDRVRETLQRAGATAGIEVLTGDQLAKEQSDEVRRNLSFFNTFLLVFALIALFVGAFIIYNAFSIIVTQRTRELGLLRAIGASGGQVTGSVAMEALLMGVFASVVGLVSGVAVALALEAILRASDLDLPSGNLIVQPRTVIVSLVVGTLVTFVSALAPARRAARVAPIVALRDQPVAPSSGARRYIVGAALVLFGIGLLALGLLVDVGSGGGSAGIVGGGAGLVFIGVAMLSPLVARPVTRVLGWLPAKLRGEAGVLARENALRNPRRTASTAAALMIGVAIVSVVAILGASLRTTLRNVLQNDLHADFLMSVQNFFPFSPEAADAVRQALPGATITQFRFGQFELNGETKALLGTTTNVGSTIDLHPRGDALRRFKDQGGMLVYKDVARDLGVHAGSRLRVRFAQSGDHELPVAGIFDSKNAIGNDYVLALRDYEANYTDQADTFFVVRKPSGMTTAEARQKLKHALEPFPNVRVQDQEQFRREQESRINQFLNLMLLLLAFAVIIAMFGIALALWLSIFERTRELGLLRAVGMTRRQLGQMVRYESGIIAIFGALLGVVLGIGFGVAMVQALRNQGIQLGFPVTQLVAFVVIAGIAGLVFGMIPAWRARRLDVLRAVSSE